MEFRCAYMPGDAFSHGTVHIMVKTKGGGGGGWGGEGNYIGVFSLWTQISLFIRPV